MSDKARKGRGNGFDMEIWWGGLGLSMKDLDRNLLRHPGDRSGRFLWVVGDDPMELADARYLRPQTAGFLEGMGPAGFVLDPVQERRPGWQHAAQRPQAAQAAPQLHAGRAPRCR